ncbi:MAG: hypothetical protein HRT57_09075 [Crocinitomicaceae bacterium]|nr:hypothetical protein [Crocinitomicaceae bacterium]
MNKIAIVIVLGGLAGLTACTKVEGSGGTSSVTGTVQGRTYSSSGGESAEQEITQAILPEGSAISDGDYILLNTPNGGTLYYVWFKWVNGVQPDPGLSGRTGIQVDFDFSESNTMVATSMLAALNANASADFTFSVNNDIITITNIATGEVADADELSSNILIDIQNQGGGATAGSSSFTEEPMVDERVYLIYGGEGFYSESVRTDADGNYQFTGLNRGNYTIYAFTEDTLNLGGTLTQVETTVNIAEKKQVVTASELYIIK